MLKASVATVAPSRASRPEYVAIDCEMIGDSRSGKSYLAHVAIVDSDGNTLMNAYVKPPDYMKYNVSRINYRTEFSGITAEKLEGAAKSFTAVQKDVIRLISGKSIVGHALMNDFKTLQFNPESFERLRILRVLDTANIPFFMQLSPNGKQLQPRRLQTLAQEFLGKEIQVGEHDALEDARTAMELVMIYEKELAIPKEVMMERFMALRAANASKGGTRRRKRIVGTRRRRANPPLPSQYICSYNV